MYGAAVVNPMLMTAAGPVMSSYPMGYGGGMFNRWGRWGWGPGYGINGSSWYNPYAYMNGYWY